MKSLNFVCFLMDCEEGFIFVRILFLIGLQIEREGKDVTITAFSKMVGYALQVC